MRNACAYIVLLLGVSLFYSCDLKKSSQVVDNSSLEVEIPGEFSMVPDTTITNIEPVDTIIEAELPFITYQRTYCFGMCPVFKSSISNEGKVLYEGINFVDDMGMNMAMLSDEQMTSLKEQLLSVHYFELDSVYNNEMITDLPSVITSATLDGQSNHVLDRWKSPDELKNLYQLLDDIYADLKWEPSIETE